MLILSPFVPRYLLHPSLPFSLLLFSLRITARSDSPLPSLDAPSVPLYLLFIRRSFVRSRSVHVSSALIPTRSISRFLFAFDTSPLSC
jgi:hypothetical protein